MKFSVSDEERRAVYPGNGFVVVYQFVGPRGRLYRRERTKMYATLDKALERVEVIRRRPYAHGAFLPDSRIEAHEVNWKGEVVA